MPTTDMDHQESWVIRIKREKGDDWPDIPMPSYFRPGSVMIPDTLEARIGRTARQPAYAADGANRRKDGKPGAGRWTVWGNDLPDWAVELCRTARTALGITEEATGVPL